jgi:hypothetical protein
MGVSKEGNHVDCPFSLGQKARKKGFGEVYQNYR